MLNLKSALRKYRIITVPYLISKDLFVLWLPLLVKKPTMIRFLVRWFISFLPGRAAFKDGLIWIPFEGINWLNSYLKRDMEVFEWGSGGSTLFFARKVKRLISAEHSPEWHKIVSEVLIKNNIINCDYLLKEPESGKSSSLGPSQPKSFLSSSPRYQEVNFEEYCKAIDHYPDNFFDLVSVDGRARPSCVLQAMPKVKVGGFILLDDSNGPGYAKALELLKDWQRKDFIGPKPYVTNSYQTSIWQKQA